MNFSEKKLFVYSQNREKKFSFAEMISAYKEGRKDWKKTFALSGMSDLMETMEILEEYYSRHFPIIDWKELDRSNKDPIYNEPKNLRREFTRSTQIPTYVGEDDKRQRLRKQGTQTEQTVDFTTGVINLLAADYWPESGDEVVWRGTLYLIGQVITEKGHYHQNTGFPLHVTCKASISQWGDESAPKSLTSLGRLVTDSPQGRNVAPVKGKTGGHSIPVIR